MTYEPTEWKSGDVVTSQKLNKLENGVASASSGGVMVVHLTVDWDDNNATTADKTVNEICAAVRAGAIVFADIPDDDYHEFLSLYRANADPEGDMSLSFIQVDRLNSSFAGIIVTASGTADDPDADLWTYSDF